MCKETQSALVCTAYKACGAGILEGVDYLDRQTLKMAVAFENCDVVLSEERTEHINDCHVRLDLHPRVSKFKQSFHLASCLARLTKMTWQDSDKYEIVEEGFRQGHGHYFVYVFTLSKVIGTDRSLGVSDQENMYLFFLATLNGSKISHNLSISIFRQL